MACSLVLAVTDVDTVRPVLPFRTPLVATIAHPSHPTPTPPRHSVTDRIVVTLTLLTTAHAKRSLRTGCETIHTTMKVNPFVACWIGERWAGRQNYLFFPSLVSSSFFSAYYSRCKQFVISPETIERELWPVVCEQRQLDRFKDNYSIEICSDYINSK